MRALLSVWDKTGIAELARELNDLGFEIISTGGTLRTIEEANIPAIGVSDVTGFPEILTGRVKSLHPAIHGGLLARRDLPEQVAEIETHGITPIDLVVCNLYPFSDTVQHPDTELDVALENIDIGGPAMIRAAAKNFPSVLVAVDPADYNDLVDRLRVEGLQSITLDRRRQLAAKAFSHVAAYDSVVAAYLTREDFPEHLTVAGKKLSDLRYGENPHQRAAIYRTLEPIGAHGAASWSIIAGKQMSFNNYLDANAAWEAASSFTTPTAAVVKHTVPCGLATNADIVEAYQLALAADPVSAFGGVVAVNRPVDARVAEAIAGHHYDIVLAPMFDDQAIERLTHKRKNLRLVACEPNGSYRDLDLRVINGAILVQSADNALPRPETWEIVTSRHPDSDQLAQLAFAWQTVRYVKSNAIVLVRDSATVGIGGGQPNRVDAVRIAVERAGERAQGSVLASDAFFPFADGVQAAAEAGITAVAQPGGSVRDSEVVDAANEAGIAMVFTGERHFRH